MLDEFSDYVVLGANGQLGRELCARLPGAITLTRQQLDIGNRDAVESIGERSSSVIFNAAAYTAVDEAETPAGRREAWSVNATGVRCLANLCRRNDLTLVHFSTDYVFDGTQLGPYCDDAPICPLGVYGASKAAGDQAVAMVDWHLLIRTSWVVGDGHNFVRIMMRRAAAGMLSRVVNDQFGRPTFTTTLVDALDHFGVFRGRLALHSTFNITNGGEPASWCEVAQAVYLAMDADPGLVIGTSSEEYFADKPQAAPRPRNSVLNLAKLREAGYDPPDWREELKRYVAANLNKL
jgi:dTDP-4-dehydrorhamnose reductase